MGGMRISRQRTRFAKNIVGVSMGNDFPVGESVGMTEHGGVDLHQHQQAQQQAGDELPYVYVC